MAKKYGKLSAGAAALLGISLLAGCHKRGIDAKNASPQSVASQVAASDLKPEAGRWESTLKFDKMAMDGVSPEVQSAMEQQMLGQVHHSSSCLTPEQAAKPASNFFAPNTKDCTYDHFTMGSGAIDAKMTCKQQGSTISVTLNGSYDTDNFHISTTTDGTMPGGRHMSSAMTMTAHHVGACTGTEGHDSQ